MNSGGILGVISTGNLTGAGTAVVNSGGILSVDSGTLDANAMIDPSSVGIVALNASNSVLSGVGGSSTFLGSLGSSSLTSPTLAPGAGNAYRLGGGGGMLTIANGVLTDGANPRSVIVGSNQPNGSGTVVLQAANNYTGGTNVNAGKLSLTTGSIVGGNVNVNSGGTLGVTSTANLTDATPTALINAVGILSVDANFDPNAMINPASVGIVALNSSPTANSSLSGVNGSSAFLGSLGSNSLTSATLSPGAGNVYRLGGGGGTLTIVNGVLTGASNSALVGSTQANGSGTVVLDAANNYGGGTAINAGKLSLTTGSIVGGNVNVNSGGTLGVTSTGNLTGGAPTALFFAGGILSIDANFDPNAMINPSSVGIVALNSTPNNTLSGVGGSSAFIGSLGANTLSATTLSAGAGNAYRLGGAGGTLTVTATNVLTGPNSLIVGSSQANGSGTVALSAANNYSLGTTISAGSTLQISNNGGAMGTGAVTNNGSLTFTNSTGMSVGNLIGGSGSVTQSGAGTTTLSTANSYSGGTTISAGGITVGNQTALGAGSVSNSGTLTLSNSSAMTVNNIIAGTGGLVQGGTGAATLSAANTFNGATTVNSGNGALQLGNANAVQNSSVTISGSGVNALQFAAGITSFNMSGLAASSTSVTLALYDAAGLPITLNINGSGTNTYAAVISGTNANVNVNGGTQIVFATETYTGATNINNATLQIGNGSTGGALSTSTTITDNGTLAFDRSSALTVSNAISGSGGITQTGTSAGTISLTGSNSYTGPTAITTNSTLSIGTGSTGGTLGTGNVSIVSGGTLSFNRSNALAVANNISGQGAIAQAGAGTTTLSGTNTYTGGTTISGGDLFFSTASSLPSTGSITLSPGGALVVDGAFSTIASAIARLSSGASGALALDGSGSTSSETVTLATATSTLSIGAASGSTVTYNGALTPVGNTYYLGGGGGTLNYPNQITTGSVVAGNGGGGTLVLSNTSNSYAGGTTINAGTLNFATSGGNSSLGTGNITFAGGTLQFANGNTTDISGKIATTSSKAISIDTNGNNVSFGSAISPTTTTVGVTKLGAGTLTLASASNGFKGVTTINAGTIAVSNDTDLGPAPSGVTAAQLTLGGGTLEATTANFSLAANRGITLTNSTTSTLSPDGGMKLTIPGLITGTTGSLVIGGAGTVALSGVNTTSFTGATTVSSGVLELDNVNSMAGSQLTVNATNGLTFGTAASSTVNLGTLAGTGNFNITTTGSNAMTLSVGASSTASKVVNTTYSGNLGGNGSLAKVGTGILVLGGTNTYSGGTTISAGDLQLASVPTTGTITVALGGALMVDGVYTTVAGWLGDAHLATASTGALSLDANDNENISMGSFSTLSLGAGVGFSVQYTGTLTPAGTTYYLGGGGTITLPNVNALTGSNNLIVGNGGGGTVILNAANNFVGTTTINNGTLQVGVGGALGSNSNTVTINGGGTLAFGNTQNIAFGNTVTTGSSGTVILTQTGAGTTTMSSNFNVASGATANVYVVGGKLELSSGQINGITGSTVKVYAAPSTSVNSAAATTYGTLGVTSASNLSGTATTVIVYPKASLSIDADFNANGMIDNSSAGVVALGANNSTLTGVNGSSAFIGAFGSYTLSTATLSAGATNTYRLGGDGGTLTISNGVLTGANNSVMVGSVVTTATAAAIASAGASITVGTPVVNGLGTVVLEGNNTYAGGTSINAGSTLQLGDSNSSTAVAGTGLISGSGTLAFGNASLSTTMSVGNVINGSLNVTQNGIGTTLLTNANGFTGGSTVSAGTLQISNAAAVGTAGVVDNATFSFNSSSPLTFSNVISGSGAVTQVGAGVTTLIAANSFTGSTTISAGALQLGDGVSHNGSVAGAIVDNSSLVIANPTAQIVGNTISGSGTLTKNSAGTATLTGGNSFLGVTTINAGTLAISADNNLGTVSTPTVGQLTLNGGTLRATTSSFALGANRGLSVGASGGTITTDPSVQLTVQGQTSFAASSTLNVAANSYVKLSPSANSASIGSGATATVTSGATLELAGTASALSDGTSVHAVNVVNNSAASAGGLLASSPTTQIVGAITGSGNTVVGASAGLTANSIIQNSLTIGSGGTFTLAPSDANGNPMVSVAAALGEQGSSNDGLVLAGSLTPSSSFPAGSGSLLGGSAEGSSALAPSLGGGIAGSGVSAVPEPSSIALALFGLAAAAMVARRRRTAPDARKCN